VLVAGDKKRLVQVVANLLTNAAKYTPEGGNILLTTVVHDDQVQVEVTDNGIGMDSELVQRAFDLFAQAERTSDRSSGGLGLGLALVKSLVELHGGVASCASAGPGKGSTFTVTLPRLQEQPGHADHVRDAEPLQAARRPLRVMVVDDNVDAALMLTMLLEAAGHEVTVEHDAYRALERARTDKPDVCLVDIGLPELDGNQLAKRLRSLPESSNAVLIAVTGYGQESDRKNALAAGFDHHLVKPVDTKRQTAILNEIALARSSS
jgi:CheY-like chemotaxis protein